MTHRVIDTHFEPSKVQLASYDYDVAGIIRTRQAMLQSKPTAQAARARLQCKLTEKLSRALSRALSLCQRALSQTARGPTSSRSWCATRVMNCRLSLASTPAMWMAANTSETGLAEIARQLAF